jgi:L-ascorbate metabolism protein UlaG (beta-lactamase superfamily)
VGDWIEAAGKRLAYIYITHWHADHWLGTGPLVARFPGAVVYASPATVRRIADSTPDGVPQALWSTLVYNHVHQYLAETPHGGFEGWHRALDIVEKLRPAHVVAGHKDATGDDSPAHIAATRRYLDDAAKLLAAEPSREEFFAKTLAMYPDGVNPFTVWLNATRLLSD